MTHSNKSAESPGSGVERLLVSLLFSASLCLSSFAGAGCSSDSTTDADVNNVDPDASADTSEPTDTEAPPDTVADTSEPTDTEAPPDTVADTSEAADTEAPPDTVADTSEAADTEAPDTVADTSEPADTEAPDTVADTSEPLDTKAPDTVADTSEPLDTEAPDTGADTIEPADTEAPDTVADTDAPPDSVVDTTSPADTEPPEDTVPPPADTSAAEDTLVADTGPTPDTTQTVDAVCGNYACEAGETCATCEPDCGMCPHDCCDEHDGPGCSVAWVASCVCGNDFNCCRDGNDWDAFCTYDAEYYCRACPSDGCGDGYCDVFETCETCPQDCGGCPTCGDGYCNGYEGCDTCPDDCGLCQPSCGDGACTDGEMCRTCPADCGACTVCGDGACEGAERCWRCPEDCGACDATCGDGICAPDESCRSCPGDCGDCGHNDQMRAEIAYALVTNDDYSWTKYIVDGDQMRRVLGAAGDVLEPDEVALIEQMFARLYHEDVGVAFKDGSEMELGGLVTQRLLGTAPGVGAHYAPQERLFPPPGTLVDAAALAKLLAAAGVDGLRPDLLLWAFHQRAVAADDYRAVCAVIQPEKALPLGGSGFWYLPICDDVDARVEGSAALEWRGNLWSGPEGVGWTGLYLYTTELAHLFPGVQGLRRLGAFDDVVAGQVATPSDLVLASLLNPGSRDGQLLRFLSTLLDAIERHGHLRFEEFGVQTDTWPAIAIRSEIGRHDLVRALPWLVRHFDALPPLLNPDYPDLDRHYTSRSFGVLPVSLRTLTSTTTFRDQLWKRRSMAIFAADTTDEVPRTFATSKVTAIMKDHVQFPETHAAWYAANHAGELAPITTDPGDVPMPRTFYMSSHATQLTTFGGATFYLLDETGYGDGNPNAYLLWRDGLPITPVGFEGTNNSPVVWDDKIWVFPTDSYPLLLQDPAVRERDRRWRRGIVVYDLALEQWFRGPLPPTGRDITVDPATGVVSSWWLTSSWAELPLSFELGAIPLEPHHCDTGYCPVWQTCGDGDCAPEESCGSCALDCGPCPCSDAEVRDCVGDCVDAGALGDGHCDPSLLCADHGFDGGDCAGTCGADALSDCDGGCAPASSFRDGVCDLALACAAGRHDGGDCAGHCDATEVDACDRSCVGATRLGDGVCDRSLLCAAFDFDRGDCTTCADPSAIFGCQGECLSLLSLQTSLGDGQCDAALDCVAFDFDFGDCATAPICGDGRVRDCAGACDDVSRFWSEVGCLESFNCPALGHDAGECCPVGQHRGCDGRCVAALPGDGVCDGALLCAVFAWDGGDCRGGCSAGEVETCDGGCASAYDVGDGRCDGALACAATDYDGGDCAAGCAAGEVEDCDGACFDGARVGDGTCDAELDCAATARDGGDCAAPGACSEDGWCWRHPTPHGNAVNALWGTGAAPRWAVGAHGALMEHTSAGWVSRSAPTHADLHDVWGAAANDVWAVGDEGVILRFDGVAWAAVVSPTSASLRGVWGSGPDDVWAVGHEAVLRYDGGAWVAQDVDPLSLEAVWGTGPDDVYAVGAGWGGVIVHWDGESWAYEYTPSSTSETLHSVWGDGSGGLWTASERRVYRSSGNDDWAYGPTLPYGTCRQLRGTADDDVWIVGDDTVAQWNGAKWLVHPMPGRVRYRAVWAGGDETWVGGAGGVLIHRVEDAWSQVFGEDTGEYHGYADVFVADGVVVAAGVDGVLDTWQGDARRRAAIPDGYRFTAVGGAPGASVWAMGTVDADTRFAMRFDGAGWSAPIAFPGGPVRGVWGAAADDVWAVGDDGMLHFDGSAWAATAVTVALSSIDGGSATNAWAVGGEAIWRLDATGWHAFEGPGAADMWLDDVAVTDGGAWAIGFDQLWRFDGSGWSQLEPPPGSLTGVWASSAGAAWITGDPYGYGRSVVVRHDGTDWAYEDTGATVELTAIDGAEPDGVWIVGEGPAAVSRPLP